MYDNLWIKVAVNMFNGSKSKIIDTYDERDTIHYVWFRSMALAGVVNDNGYLYINQDMPYTIKTLAIEFNRPVEDVKFAIKILKKLQMIEYTEDKFFRVKNWNKHQNVDALEKIRLERNNRVAKHRAKIKSEKMQKENQNTDENTNFESNSNNNPNIIITINSNEPSTNINNKDNTKTSGEDLDSNVTCNNEVTNSNVTVTDKIKNKKKTKNKKIEIEREDDNIPIELEKNSESDRHTMDKDVHSELISDQNLKEKPNDIKVQNESSDKYEIQSVDPDLSEICARLSKYHEAITGRIGRLENGKLRGTIAIHGEVNVKKAIDAAIKAGIDDINYINGILSNWRREGYPKDNMEVKKNGFRSTGKSNSKDKNEFAGFKPKEPRKLTEAERKRIEANLI